VFVCTFITTAAFFGVINDDDDDDDKAFQRRNSAIADKPRNAFRGQSRSANMVPFNMLGIWFPISVLY